MGTEKIAWVDIIHTKKWCIFFTKKKWCIFFFFFVVHFIHTQKRPQHTFPLPAIIAPAAKFVFRYDFLDTMRPIIS